MTREDASGFEHFALCERAAKIVSDLRDSGLPMMGFQVQDAGHHIGFLFRKPDGQKWGFRVPRGLLNRETVEKMLRAYL